MNHRPPPLFVTGTDTGVGKTLVARGLLRALVRAGLPAAPLKLIETGCARRGDRLAPDDGAALARAARCEHALDIVAPERFELPAAPRTAARVVGRTIHFADLFARVERAAALAPRLVLEGAGGLLVPIGPEGTFADLAARLGAPVLVVSRDALGTLNHTLLTLEAARARGLVIAGVVLNAIASEPCSLDHRRELAESMPNVPIWGPLPWLPGADDDTVADALARAALDPRRIDALFAAD